MYNSAQYDLPEIPCSWIWTTLSEIAEVKGGLTKGKRRKIDDVLRKVPYLRVANVQRGYLALDEVRTIEATETEISALQLKKGDILFTEGGDRDKLGRGWIWSNEILECIHQNHVFRARLYWLKILPKFISLYGNSAGQKYFLDAGRQTTNLASINLTKLSNLPIPLPPLNEQRRIVAKIEELTARSRRAREALDDVPTLIEQFRQSVLAAAFRGDLTADWREQVGSSMQTWIAVELKTILSEPLANGRSVPDGEGFPVLRLTCLKDGWIDTKESKTGSWQKEDAERFLIQTNDFLIARGNGSLSLVGRGGLVRTVSKEVAYPDTLIRMRVNPNLILPQTLRLIWNSRGIRKQVESSARTTAGIYKINQKSLQSFELELPTLKEQKIIIQRLEAVFEAVNNIEREYYRAMQMLAMLDQSILAKAFRGELVPQDPNDEPAAVLLERIRAEREKLGLNKKSKRSKRSG